MPLVDNLRIGEPVLRWSARAHSIAEIEVELARIWSGQDLSTSVDGNAARHVAARTSVMNLIVVARRPEIAERTAATMQALTGRHPSRTIVIQSADPDGPSWLDARVEAHCVVPREDAPETCAETIHITCGGEAGRHLSAISTPLVVHDLPVAVWWPGEPLLTRQPARELLEGADRLIVDGSTWSGDGPTDSGQFSWINAADGSLLQTLAPRHPFLLAATVSPDGKFVAFNAFERPGNSLQADVFVMASDGSGEIRVSEKASLNAPVGWSADGRHLFYADDALLWKVPMGGGRIQGAAIAVDVPHRGQVDGYLGVIAGTIYYRITTATSDIYTASMDPVSGLVTSPPALAPTPRNGGNYSLRWSPDSRRLLYQSVAPTAAQNAPRVLRIITLEDGKDQRVADRVVYGGPRACWAPDGRSILVNTVTEAQPVREEPARVDLATGESRILFPGAPSFRIRSCSDSLMAAYQAGAIIVRNIQTGADTEVYRLKRNAPTVPNVTWGIPKLSHDGRTVLFVEWVDETTSALMTVPSTGGPARTLVRVRTPAQLQPQIGFTWSPDDRFAYFLRRANATAPHELFRVPAAGGAEERMGLAGADVRDLDIAPDGRRIAFSLGAVGRQEIWAMENFPPAGR